MIAKETIVKKVARLLGLAATEGAGWTVAAFKVARTRTRAVLLEAASLLGLSGVSKLKKEDLARQVVDVLKEIRKAAGRATESSSAPARTAAKARPTKAAPQPSPRRSPRPRRRPPRRRPHRTPQPAPPPSPPGPPSPPRPPRP
ncbi:MAG: hypothetical protein IPQ24_11485 [Anaeromyxobacter sp.]|nr:hypothetical protein [Anaeromyxobacter sp.]